MKESKSKEKQKETKARKFSEKNVKEWIQNSSDKKSRIVSIIGGLVLLLVFVVGLMIQRNSQTGSISPELARAMTYAQFEEGDEAVEGTDNVKFSAFFLRDINSDGYAEKLSGTCKEIGKEDTLYMEINVQTAGYLKNAKIQINGKNFYLQTALPKDNELKDNYIGNNIKEIEFNQIANGTQKLLSGIVRSGDYSYSSNIANAIGKDTSKYSVEDNQIILTGIYVDENGNETSITKTINLAMDWYGTVKTSLYKTNQTYDTLDSIINQENQTIKLNFAVTAKETVGELNLSKSYVEGIIPELNGYAPIEVSLVRNNANFTYDEETRTFTVQKEATVDETGTITNVVSESNTYNIQVIYPLEAYETLGTETVEIRVTVEAYYEGYNNPNEEFENPYRSNTATATIVATFEKKEIPDEETYITDFNVTVGKHIATPTGRYSVSKQKPLKIYNGVSESETNDTYLVTWKGYTGTNAPVDGMIMKESETDKAQQNDEFIKTDGTTDSMENVTTNIGIYFGNTTSILGEDGWIKVYNDETDELLMTFDKTNLSQYTNNNPYYYTTPVKHIRVETSKTINEKSLYVYNIKELDDDYITTNYTEEEFNNLQYIKSTLVGYLGSQYMQTDVAQAVYEAPYSVADISISKNAISTQGTEKNEKIIIETRANESYNQVKWENGSFLVKLPTEIISAEINEVTINSSNVQLSSYELVEQEGNQFIKINTTNTTPQTYTITIDVNVTPDPRIATTSAEIELYASNGVESDYYYKVEDIYDVNDNLNTQENINKRSTSISFVSPNSLLTNQTASNYDEAGSVAVAPQVADIKPNYAVVDGEEKTAQIGIQIKNNYASTISDVLILGKIPFEGNTYVISGEDLGSNFTTKMTNAGIQIPEELKGQVKVYYSENKNPGKEIDNTENGWKTAEEVTNWDNIKTFLIYFKDYAIPQGKEYVFSYTVKIPEGLGLNQVAYSHHGVYYSLETEEGKYRTQTEPNKLGFRIAEKYSLELFKYQTGKEKLVSGATYKILEEGQEEGKTAVTNSEGKLIINNIYAEKTYILQEIKSPDDYHLNEEIIKFIVHVDDNGNLSIEKLEGTTREDIVVETTESKDYKIVIKVEDEPKVKLKILKKEQGTDTLLQGVRYKVTGTGIAESGRTILTNINGEATIKGLKIDEEYAIQEVKAEGYYLADQIKFKIINNNGTYEIQLTEGETKESAIIEEDSIPTVKLTLEDEKIPTYNLEITKIKKTIDVNASGDEQTAQAEQAITEDVQIEVLEGAKFELYKDNKLIGEYTTGENGKLTIDNLYQYVEGKDIDATYTLKEVLAPVGYAKVKDITFKVQEIEGELQFQADDDTERNYTVEGNTLKLQIADSPSFKLIKIDQETQETLANIKFAIYNVEDGEQPAKNSKGEILGAKEIINGKEYYTLTTNENGEITADLQEGLYKAVEVQAPEQYDITNATYYFGIGASREVEKRITTAQAKSIGGSGYDYINSLTVTSDGGYIAGGTFFNNIQVGNATLTNAGSSDGMIIKYSSEEEVEWAKSIGGSDSDYINSVAETSDGGYIVGGYFSGSSIQVGNEVLTNTNADEADGMIIKYTAEGEVEWARSIGGDDYDSIKAVAGTSDGGYIVGGSFYSDSIEVGSETITNAGSSDGVIIKYSSEGVVEWIRSIGGSISEQINSIAETSDGSYIVGGSFSSTSIQVGNETLTNAGIVGLGSSYDGVIIKYNGEGEVEWARSVGGGSAEEINSVEKTLDGGIIAGGYFSSSTLQLGNETLTSAGSSDGIIIKYNSEGEVEWAEGIGGDDDEKIYSVAEASDGGIIAGGYFTSDSIQVGNETVTNIGLGNIDGLVIKYSTEGEGEWGVSTGGKDDDYINSVVETLNGAYIAGGYFNSESIQVKNETLTNAGSTDGIIIKYELEEIPNIVVKQAKSIGGSSRDYVYSIAGTSDGGIIAGGYFNSKSIQVGNEILTNTSSSTSLFDGMIIKYTSDGEVEWARCIGGSGSDYIYSIAETSDGGYIAGGYFESSTLQVGNETLTNTSSGYKDGMIIKYTSDGEVEWARSIGGSDGDQINSVAETTGGGVIAGGYFASDSIQLGNETLTNAGLYDEMVIKYSSEGEVEWARSIGGSSSDYIYSIVGTSDGGYIAGGYFQSTTLQVGNETLTNAGSSDGMIIKYSSEGEVEWTRSIGGSSNDYIYSIAETSEGEIIVGGCIGSSIQVGSEVLTNAGGSDGIIIKYSSKGEEEWIRTIGGSSNDYIYSVAETSNGEIIAGGSFNSTTIQVGKETLTNVGNSDGMIIDYNNDGEVEWARGIGESNIDNIKSVAETNDAGIIVGGYYASSTLQAENETLTNEGSYDGMIIKYQVESGVPEVQEVVAENEIKQFKITTDVSEIDGIKGGSISGEDQSSYEAVKYGENSIKEIKMIPDENYEIIAITVNGQEYPYEVSGDGSYTMPQFENVTEDKHIEVTYSLTENKITINKVDSATKAPLVGAKFRLDQIDETLDDSELYHVEVETNSNGQAITQIPFGKYNITEIQAPDGYELNETPVEINFSENDKIHEFTITNQKAGRIIVHHYIKGTETQVAEDETLTGKIGENYTTSPLLDLQKYELEKDSEGEYIIPENATGTYESSNKDVIYYYVEKEIPLTVHHYIEGTENKVPLLDGTEAQDVESQGKEGEEYTTSAILDSELSDKYELVEVPENATGTYNGDEVIVTYYYKKVERKVILTKYQEDGITPLEGAKFTIETKGEANNESTIYTTDSQGKIYTTLEAGEYIVTEIEAPEGYALPEDPTTEVTITKNSEEAQIDLTNSKKQGSVIVHYYIEGTTDKVPLQDGSLAEDVTKTGTIGDIYVTKELENVSNKYVLKEIPENASGNITEETTEVIYYYRLAPTIETSEITKTSTTQKVAQEEQKIPYTITYTANIDNHIGEAEVTIVDQLPYAIETENGQSSLDGGVYDETNKTITWTETITGIDTFTNGKKQVSITKNIEITYKDLDVTQNKVTNIATGKIDLKILEKTETVITKKEIPTEFLTDIKITKVWKDNETQAQKRPESIILVVKNGDTEVARQEISAKNQEGEDTSTWSYNFTDLEKYDENGNEIAYTVDEIEKQADDLYFYTKSIGKVTTTENSKEITITNTYTTPGDTINVTVNKVWNDNETQAQRRPETIVLQVKEGENIIDSYELNTATETSYTFTGLPKYDEKGQEITYTVDETTLEGEEHKDDLKFYTKEVTEVTDNQATIRNTFVKPDDSTEVTVNKVWNDNSNANKKRPETIVLQVKEGENVVQSYELNTQTESTHTFTELPKYDENGQEIDYTVDETVLSGEEHQDDLKFYTKSISGTTITNTFTLPDEKINLKVNKIWSDNETQAQRRPESIILLVKDGETEVARQEINVATESEYTFTDLPKYDANGAEIIYTVDEAEKVEGDLYFYSKTVGNVTSIGIENDIETKTANIINKFNLPDDKTEVKVTKIWEDNNNEAKKRPSSIVLQIKNGNSKIAEHTVTEAENTVEGNENTWEYTFTNLEKYNVNGQEIEYTADETEVNSGDLQFYTKTISGTTLTNSFTQSTDKINVTATKVWVDNDEQKDKRPNSIIIQLKNDSVVVDSKEIEINTTQDEFTVTFEELPKYDENNNIINYTVDETVLSGEEHEDDLKFYTKTISGTTITNTFTKPSDKISVKVNKVWVDKDDIYEKRPLSLTLQVKNKETEEVVANKTITVKTEDSYTFTNLEKYDENGNEIIYTADEEEVSEDDLYNYEKEIGNLENVVGETDKKQITITNIMAKVPGTVIIKYVDKSTQKEISDSTNKEGIIGESFDISDSKKDIIGYTLVEEPEEKTGTYTEEEQIRTYYYAKDTKVIVKYLEKGTNQILTPESQYEINGYEGLEYTTELKTIEGYTYIENTGKTEGTMERDTIEVIYYYAKNTKVIVKYLEKDTNIVLSEEPQYEIEGYEGKDYETEMKEFTGYTFVESTDNTTGTMIKDTIEVIYYYAQNTKVIVKYLEKDTNVVLSEEPQYEIEGYAGKDYETEMKEFTGYTFVESTDNTTGTMTKNTIEVIYYYAQNTKATVLHIDRETEEILKQDTQDGKVGDVFETHSEDFEGYVLVEVPEEPNVVMTKEEQVVKYYYAHVSAGLIEKHIDDITGDVLYSEAHEGNEGDQYDILSKTFEGYDLVESKLPENAQGKMAQDVIEVKYYYIKKASVRVEYIDKLTGEKLQEDVIVEGHENDEYQTEEKEFKKYSLVETPKNATGKMVVTKNEDGSYNTETLVQYYYIKQSAGVLEKHIDINNDKVLAQEKHTGNVGDEYDIPAREFEDYELVEKDENGNSKLPTNSEGNMEEELIEVDYYYVRKSKVIVEYIDKQTEEKLDTYEIIGHEGEKYETEDKQFDGYDLEEVPNNKTGEMEDKTIVVKYYYKKKSEVEVQYLEKDTENALIQNINIAGYVGDKYETKQEEIPYYKFVESTTNTEGTMTDEKITVIYYYEKQVFNLKIDKWISSVTIDGISQGGKTISTKDEMYKIDIHRSKTSTASVKITYKIRISNVGEIEGNVDKLIEVIPRGYDFYQDDNKIYWENNNGILTTTDLKDQRIDAGEYKEIEIVLRWRNGENNFGEKDNIVILSKTSNPAEYQDVNKEDNTSRSNMLISVATGLDRNDRIMIIGIVQIVLAISMGLLVSYKKKEK